MAPGIDDAGDKRTRAAYRDCDQVVDNYKHGRVPRTAAMRIINTTLSTVGLEDATFDRVLERYLTQLDEQDRARKRAEGLRDAVIINTMLQVSELVREALFALLK